jgi:hypothetical protein
MEFLKWQEKILTRIQKYTNRQLLDETLISAKGDDNDGEFTSRGWWEFNELRKELEKRLNKWLQKGAKHEM